MRMYTFICNYLAKNYCLYEDDMIAISKNQDLLYNIIEKKQFEHNDIENDILCNIMACIFEEQGDYNNMKKYYLMAIEKGHSDAMNSLGEYYCEQKDYKNMKKYYLMAIDKGNSVAMNNLGYYYCEQKDYDNMKSTI